MFARDGERLRQVRARTNVLPLGAGALAGVGYPIDRELVARELGFEAVAANSLDAISDRDFVVDFHAAAALAMVHLSRLAEEIVLWASAEFALVRLDDAFATGSSIMPQKRNPDVAELARGKSARAIGNLVQALTLLKGQPLAYNRDLQEDKEPLFDSVDTLLASLAVIAAMLPTLRFDAARGRAAAVADFALATDLADQLVKRGVPFRDAHAAVGALVARCEREGRTFEELTLGRLPRSAPSVRRGGAGVGPRHRAGRAERPRRDRAGGRRLASAPRRGRDWRRRRARERRPTAAARRDRALDPHGRPRAARRPGSRRGGGRRGRDAHRRDGRAVRGRRSASAR